MSWKRAVVSLVFVVLDEEFWSWNRFFCDGGLDVEVLFFT